MTNKRVPLTTDDLIRMGHQWEYFTVRIELSLSGETIKKLKSAMDRIEWKLNTKRHQLLNELSSFRNYYLANGIDKKLQGMLNRMLAKLKKIKEVQV